MFTPHCAKFTEARSSTSNLSVNFVILCNLTDEVTLS